MPAPAEWVSRFLDNACPDHHVRGRPDHVRAAATAMRILDRWPDLAQASVYTAIVCGDLAAVTRALAAQPELATRRDAGPGDGRSSVGGELDLVKRDCGPKGWSPLLYLCFTRLPLPAVADHAIAIARALIDRGADPREFFMAGDSRYTPLVGVVGLGEEGRPPHPCRDALVRLLLDCGADPYDHQVNYNLHFAARGGVLWYLKLAYDRAVSLGRHADWADPEWSMFDMGPYGSGAAWHLGFALQHGDTELEAWCRAHGANPQAQPHAAPAPTPEQALFRAAKANDVAAARQLLDAGVSPNALTRAGEHPLHLAAYDDAVDVAALLVERGAEVDFVGRQFENTALGGAHWCGSRRAIDLLARHSRDVWELAYIGKIDRLRELFAENPSLGRLTADGETPLMWLPADDEDRAIAVATLFLEHGADPSLKNKDGLTAAEKAERNAMFRLARVLGSRF